MSQANQKELWKLAIERLGINVSLIDPADERKIASAFIELYAVGERPTVSEMRAFLRELWPGQARTQREHILSFWTRLLRNPRRRFQCLKTGWPWVYPFRVVEEITDEYGLEPVHERLRQQIAAAVDEFLRQVADSPGSQESEEAARRVSTAAHALFLWGAVRDRLPDAQWPGYAFEPASDPTKQFVRCTRTRLAREEARIQRLLEEHEPK